MSKKDGESDSPVRLTNNMVYGEKQERGPSALPKTPEKGYARAIRILKPKGASISTW